MSINYDIATEKIEKVNIKFIFQQKIIIIEEMDIIYVMNVRGFNNKK